MTPRDAAIDHATACRGARRQGKPLPTYAGPTLAGADLCFASLTGANLTGVSLANADLTGASLDNANLTGANLTGANLTGVYFCFTNFTGATNLTGATMPDGRLWEAYRLDPIAGICDTPEVRARAMAATGHTWGDCPMHAALGIGALSDIDDADKQRLVAAFVAVYDGRMLNDSGWRTR